MLIVLISICIISIFVYSIIFFLIFKKLKQLKKRNAKEFFFINLLKEFKVEKNYCEKII